MAPQACRPRSSLPTLMEELVEEILLRIPPDEPAHLVRAALVCKAWRRIILSDPGFLRRYRAFHRRRPPLLGFFFNDSKNHPSFKPVVASAFPSLLAQYHLDRAWCVLDCRHGRVLLEDLRGIGTNLIVWDPISDDDWQELQAHGAMSYCHSYSAAVFCAAGGGGCDHHECRRGGPFFVVYMGADATDATTIQACVYSSEARAWCTPVSCQLDKRCNFDKHRAAVIGDEVYFVVTPGARILKYDLVKRCISLFSSPSICSEASRSSPPINGEAPVLMQNEDGSLGLASIRDSKLYLCSRMVNNREGITAGWVQWRVIELDRILPIDKPCAQAYLTGFVEGVGILFISTSVGTFTFQLESGRVRKITRPIDSTTIFPFTGFITPCKAPALY